MKDNWRNCKPEAEEGVVPYLLLNVCSKVNVKYFINKLLPSSNHKLGAMISSLDDPTFNLVLDILIS